MIIVPFLSRFIQSAGAVPSSSNSGAVSLMDCQSNNNNNNKIPTATSANAMGKQQQQQQQGVPLCLTYAPVKVVAPPTTGGDWDDSIFVY